MCVPVIILGIVNEFTEIPHSQPQDKYRTSAANGHVCNTLGASERASVFSSDELLVCKKRRLTPKNNNRMSEMRHTTC